MECVNLAKIRLFLNICASISGWPPCHPLPTPASFLKAFSLPLSAPSDQSAPCTWLQALPNPHLANFALFWSNFHDFRGNLARPAKTACPHPYPPQLFAQVQFTSCPYHHGSRSHQLLPQHHCVQQPLTRSACMTHRYQKP